MIALTALSNFCANFFYGSARRGWGGVVGGVVSVQYCLATGASQPPLPLLSPWRAQGWVTPRISQSAWCRLQACSSSTWPPSCGTDGTVGAGGLSMRHIFPHLPPLLALIPFPCARPALHGQHCAHVVLGGGRSPRTASQEQLPAALRGQQPCESRLRVADFTAPHRLARYDPVLRRRGWDRAHCQRPIRQQSSRL